MTATPATPATPPTPETPSSPSTASGADSPLTATLASITLDCTDADALARFYAAFLGLEEIYADDERRSIALQGNGFIVSCVASDTYVAPAWPTGSPGQQMHLDLYVPNLDAGVERAVELGARMAETQPAPDAYRVLLDPAGHPLCLMLPFD